MTSDEAFANLQSAMQDYASARKSLDLHRGLAKHGIANALAYAVAAEHSALHRLDRAQKAYAALQPAPTPKPPAPTPVVTSAKPSPAPTPAAPSFAEAKRDADRARDEYQAAMRRQNEAHERAVAAYQARPAAALSHRKI